MLSAEMQGRIEQDGADFRSGDRPGPRSPLKIIRYYGTFDGSVVVMFGGILSIPESNVFTKIFVWKDGSVLWLGDACEQGWLTMENVQSIIAAMD